LYEKALAASVLELKTTPRVFGRVERLLIEVAASVYPDQPSLIIPIPISSRRLQERGFNQAAIIGRVIARPFGLAVDESSLIRKVHTPMHRAGMDKKARARTVKNAFDVVRPKLVEGRNILLVDDIFTSGETASSCAKALKKSGALIVNVLTIARAA
jgi:ComF family protein